MKFRSLAAKHKAKTYLTITQRGQVVYALVVNVGAARADCLFGDNEAKLSNCFSINQVVRESFV